MITHFASVSHSPCKKIQQLTRSRYYVQLTKCRQSSWGAGRAMTFQEKLTIFSQVSDNHLLLGFFLMVICFPTKAPSFHINTNQQRSPKMTNKCIVKNSNHSALLSVKYKKKSFEGLYVLKAVFWQTKLIYSYRFQN